MYSGKGFGISAGEDTHGRTRASTSDQNVYFGHHMPPKTHPTIVPHHVRVCQHLREHGSVRRRTVRRVARAGELELLAGEDKEGRALLGRGEREELCDLEGGGAERARVVRKDGAI